MRTIKRRIVAAHIVSSDNKLLLGRKQSGSGAVYPNAWHIPGGGVDEGESDEQAIHREVLEETGLNINSAKIILTDNKGRGESEKTLSTGEKVLAKMQFNVYKVEIDLPAAEIQVVDSADLTNFHWFDVDELSKLDLTPPGNALFKRLGTDWLKFGAKV